MIGIARLYCSRDGQHWIEDIPVADAAKRRIKLISEGATVYHSELL